MGPTGGAGRGVGVDGVSGGDWEGVGVGGGRGVKAGKRHRCVPSAMECPWYQVYTRRALSHKNDSSTNRFLDTAAAPAAAMCFRNSREGRRGGGVVDCFDLILRPGVCGGFTAAGHQTRRQGNNERSTPLLWANDMPDTAYIILYCEYRFPLPMM